MGELEDNLPIYLGKLPDDAPNGWTMPEMKKERKRIAKKKWFNPDKTTQGRRLGDVNTKGMSPPVRARPSPPPPSRRRPYGRERRGCYVPVSTRPAPASTDPRRSRFPRPRRPHGRD